MHSTRVILLVSISLIIPLLLTYIGWRNAEADNIIDAQRSFEFKIKETNHTILQRMHTYEQVLLGCIGLLAASDTVTRDEWRIYVENLHIDKNFPGIWGIGYSYSFHHNDSLKITNAMKKEGFKNFKIWPEGKRDEYSSVIYIEPFDERNQRAFGYDLLSEQIRKSAMLEARDNGQTTITGKISIVRETEYNLQAGFLIFIPHYVKNYQANTPEKRKELFKGFVYSPFIMRTLMQATFGDELRNINLQIYAGSDLTHKNLMYDSDSLKINSPESLFTATSNLNLYGKTWTLKFIALPRYLDRFKTEKPTIVLLLGIMISFLFFLVIVLFLNTKRTSNKLSGLLESTAEGIFGIDNALKCSFINSSALSMLGYRVEECIGSNVTKFIKCSLSRDEEFDPDKCPLISSIKDGKAVYSIELLLERKDKALFSAEFSSHPIIENGLITGVVVTFNDITERKKVFDQIQKSLREKEVLLREIHHRVKNNLQIISSLLNLQAGFIEDKKTHEIFEESKNRVRSMALIHEKLYESKNFSSLDMQQFIEELIKYLYKSYGFDPSAISLEIGIDNLSFNADQAVYLGLIVNELVSNSFKHAFSFDNQSEEESASHKIFVFAMQDANDFCTIRIGDNGKGFSKSVDFRNTETLGLQLVMSLIRQLDGEIELNDSLGTEFIIKFQKSGVS